MKYKHLILTILTIISIILLQLSYLSSLYENYTLKVQKDIEKNIYTSINSEYLYNLANYDGGIQITTENVMRGSVRDSLLKVHPLPPTPPKFNIEELIDKDIITTTSDIGRQYNADLNYDKGIFPNLEIIDSIFCANIEANYPHTFALFDNSTGDIVSPTNVDTTSYDFYSKKFYIGTKARQFIVLYYDIKLSDFLSYAPYGIIVSILLLIIAVVLIVMQVRILYKTIAIVKENRDNIGVVVHDLKSPLSSTIMTLKLLKETTTDNEIKDIVNHSSLSVSRLLTHIESLLWSTRNGELNRQLITSEELTELCYDIASDLANIFKSKPHTFKIVTESLPSDFTFNADKYLLINTINNLVQNAIKYADDNVEIVLTVTIDRRKELNFSITDNGWGIAPKYQRKVFQYGFTVPETKRELCGHGIGLYGVKKMVKAQGGNISLHSELNKGTTINFTLPL